MPEGRDRPYGGKREGSGRKRLKSDEKTVVYAIRLPASLAQALHDLGTEAVREQLQRVVQDNKRP